MKKKIIIILAAIAVLSAVVTGFFMLGENERVSVYVVNKEAEIGAFSENGETYISAKDIFNEAEIEYRESQGRAMAKGEKILEVDEDKQVIKINGEESAFNFKKDKGEIMISPYLAGEIIGGEVTLTDDKIYIVETKPVFVKFRENNREIEFGYSDNFFMPSPFEYNHALAKMSIGVAVSAFSAKESDKFWGDKGDFGRDANAVKLFEDMGFSNIKTYNYDKSLNDTSDKVAFAVGEKTVEISGKSYRLVAVAVRGGAYGNEWVSNFNLGSGENHTGFDTAANEVVRAVKDYTGTAKDTKLWITGFSRGAAVANLTAAKLEDYLGGENIYAYTFATPNGTTNSRQSNEKYGYIYNIVNENDLVPLVAPKEWGYGRFGKTVSFPSLSAYTEAAAMEEAAKISEIYKSISTAGTFDVAEMENSNQRQQVKSTVSSLVIAMGSRENYIKGISPIMMDFILTKNTKKKDSNGNWQWMTPKESINAVFKNQGENFLARAEKDGFLSSIESTFGEVGEQIKVFGAICIKNGRDPYKVITEEIGAGNLITIASIFTSGGAESGSIAKAHYPESYIALILGISDPAMLKIE